MIELRAGHGIKKDDVLMMWVFPDEEACIAEAQSAGQTV